MVEYGVFIRNNSLRGLSENRVAGESVFDSYAAIAPRLAAKAGDDVAALFARPAVTRGNGETETTVSWYVARPGPMRVWGSLGRDEQIRMAAEIGHLLDRFRAQLGDPEIGATLAGWLCVPSLDNDLVIVGDRPCLLNWGTLPQEIAQDPSALAAHQRATLDLFGTRAALPAAAPLAASAPAAEAAAAATGRGFGWSRKTARPVPPAGAVAGAPIVIEEPRRRGWIPVAVAAGVAGLALLISFIPGVLLYDTWRPPAPPVPQIDEAARRQTAEALQQRIQQLRRELSEQVCRPIDNAPGAPPPPGRSGALPSIQPAPASLPAPQNGSLTQPPDSLRSYLVQATALVVVEGSESIAHGSAFFVNERQLVTNRHVVETSTSGRVKVVSPAFGGSIEGQVVASSGQGDKNDFAVIQVQSGGAHPVIPLQQAAEQLQPVIASGYPGLVVASDDAFIRVLRGDASAQPEPVLTEGVVTATQTVDSIARVLHSAMILSGNSGGPLVDKCGRLIGVNTYVKRNQEQVVSLNFALGTQALRDFLVSNQIAFTADAACPSPPQAAAPAPAPAPGPAPATGATPPAARP